jgi:isopentenyl-diphosphate delta-isomerase type 1
VSDLIDVLSSEGFRTGEILSRAEVHRLGKHHRAVHLYLFNSKNEILLQKRALTVDSYPGFYSISVLGHVNAGESSSAAVRREVQEELGLDSTQLKFDFLFSFFQEATLSASYVDRQFSDVYVTHADINPALIKFDGSEVSEIKFVPFEGFRKMVSDKASGLAPVYENESRDLIYFLEESLFGNASA